ncbi:hypothetical protein NC653_029848 [Populus alba x Populus x berolinensis]|uniref:Pectinesterase inhibitor domain-containing protein n=1 Tax=Populus alba x Populus x berolinensis TaxID=444605 RepID=A0AAD6M323_9ROSI|nr:hypothetical protein NC653_029848 [Populus alba x Populus x berolinensis]
MERRELRPREAGAIKDCVETMKDSVDELRNIHFILSFNSISRRTRQLPPSRLRPNFSRSNAQPTSIPSLKGSDIEFQIANIKTWISAAITDEDTCTEGFEERNITDEVMIKIRKSIVNVARLTSNGLALINKLIY